MSNVCILKENKRLSDWELFYYFCMIGKPGFMIIYCDHLTDYLIKTSMVFIY